MKQSADRILVHEGGHHRGCLSRVLFLCIRKVLETWCDANENCEAILGGQNAGFALLYGIRKVLETWCDANENCEAILGGQNAGFALLCWRPTRQKGVRT